MSWNKVRQKTVFTGPVIFDDRVEFKGLVTVRQLSTSIASSALTVGAAIAMDGSAPVQADHTILAHADRVVGIYAGNGQIVTSGEVSGPWSLTPGLPVFVGQNGEPVHSVPSVGFQQKLAVATSSSTMIISVGDAIVLAS